MFLPSWQRPFYRLLFRRRPARGRRSVRFFLERLEDRLTPAGPINVGSTPQALINAIDAADHTSGPVVLNLPANTTYTFTTPVSGTNPEDQNWYGPDALPAIDNNITINGNGSTLQRSTAAGTPDFRFFYVSGGLELPAGSLTLNNLTLTGGSARGGDGFDGGGGGLGAGGAVFNQGTLNLNGVTLNGNTATGGNGGASSSTFVGGGGGMGSNADSSGDGGGFGGSSPFRSSALGGTGGSGTTGGSGGGGGFLKGDDGGSGSDGGGGSGGGQGGLGGLGDGGGGPVRDGGGGGISSPSLPGGAGGDFGFGGLVGNSGGGGGGGGGVGGGGGGGFLEVVLTVQSGASTPSGVGGSGGGGGGVGDFVEVVVGGGGGGFGGGGGGGGGFGGFGGGGGESGGGGGFGGGGGGGAGGGAGLGGGIFTMNGSTTLINTTLTGNKAQGGNGGAFGDGGSGFGGGLFNLDGSLTLLNDTVAANTVVAGAAGAFGGSAGAADVGAVYNLAFGNVIQTGGPTSANLTLNNNILATSSGGKDLISQAMNGNGTNTATVSGSHNLVMSSSPIAPGVITLTANPNLGPLQNNGGPTQTMALTANSPAFGAGSATIAGLPATDQRGYARSVNNQVDLGSFEVQSPKLSVANVTTSFTSVDHSITLSATARVPGGASLNEGQVQFTIVGISSSPVTANVINGQASTTFTVPGGTPVGNYTIAATYSDPNGDFRGATANGTLTVKQAFTSISVSDPELPFTPMDPPITVSAIISSPGAAAVNEGQVQFAIAGLAVTPVTAPVLNGQATVTLAVPANTPLGTYTITATYTDGSPGDFLGATGTNTLTVAPSPTTTTINNVSIVYTLFGEQETLTAVTRNALGQPANSGIVRFTDGGISATAPIINSVATVTLNIPLFSENPFAHTLSVAFADNSGNFFASSSLFTLEQTLMDYLFQILAVISFVENNSANT